ncbi:response regulator transcription factor [Lysinibacillus sphaericus]|uniref:DNA-binding response regulator n=3 Tax=Lysinibacillus TaxID=400634 RepID=A0A2S0JYS5_LYSSH|nr:MULTISPECIES: response regulator transcription factor [Lysinibacillus]AHN22493.1 XRE family transcriptional regulator [Lysinibacillus varians]AVK96246.1 DNA-binding response regulator [Lysinibacillus sphaericus]MED4544467.1 response regulator transcription factor [Lysinibacillus sphaericus]TKI18077.1 response regulator transcription factor [Lysinibacillus sphaericus]TKI50135.1 response regulator transcription factor [Lysinibacillus tabacifolii]
MNKRILVVEDDIAIGNLIKMTLTTQNYEFDIMQDGSSALQKAITFKPNVIILDLGLPDMDGLDFIHKIRSWTQTPIIVVSARGAELDKINALDAGADDYVTKPFSVEELLARIRVALRRTVSEHQIENESAVFVNGHLEIDYLANTVFVNGVEVHLTPIEYKLLVVLSKHVGKVLTHNFLLKEIWQNVLQSDVPSLRVFMATLRKKIEDNPSQPKYIQTHVRVGYRMLRYHDDD